MFFSSLDSTNFTSTTEQLIRHFTSLIKPEVLSVSVCEAGKLLLYLYGVSHFISLIFTCLFVCLLG